MTDMKISPNGVMKEFTGGDFDPVGEYYYLNTIFGLGYEKLEYDGTMILLEANTCFFKYAEMVKMKRTPIDKNSQYKFFSTIDISDLKHIITNINEKPMLLEQMIRTSTYNFAQAFIIKHYIKHLEKQMI